MYTRVWLLVSALVVMVIGIAVVYGGVVQALPAIAVGSVSLAILATGETLAHRRDLRRLAAGIASLGADGHLDLSRRLSANGVGAAVRPVANAVDRATYDLNSIMLDIHTASKKFSLFSSDIYFSGQQLSAVSDEQAQLMVSVLAHAERFRGEMSKVVEHVAEGLFDMERTGTRYQELRSQTAEARSRLEPLATATTAARELAATGREHMDRSRAATGELTPAIGRLNDQIDQMLERSAEIGTVLSALQDIAEKTHVLATNASIEAARAGSAGRGFGVIAGEIRTLAADSRRAIEEVERFLSATVAETRDSAEISRQAAARVGELERYSADTGRSLEDIVARVEAVSTSMEEFHAFFGRQEEMIGETIDESERVHRVMEAVGEEIERHASEYEEIQSRVDGAADGARRAAHSARVLSQLGTYLRTGGQELSHVVETVTASETRFLAGLQRKEPRTTLLYNLEVFRGDELLGHLGDISPSGLMLYAPEPLREGVAIDAAIHLPLSFGEQRDIPVRFVPRRNEQHAWFVKVGCSIDAESSRRQREDIEMIITSYTVSQGLDTLVADQTEDSAAPVEDLEPLDE